MQQKNQPQQQHKAQSPANQGGRSQANQPGQPNPNENQPGSKPGRNEEFPGKAPEVFSDRGRSENPDAARNQPGGQNNPNRRG